MLKPKGQQPGTSKILGRYGLGHFRIPAMEAPSEGCRPTIWMPGSFSFKNLLTPIMVPARPATHHLAVTHPRTCAAH